MAVRGMNGALERLRAAGAIRHEERTVAGRVAGLVWVIASLSVIAMALVLPATHRTALEAIGAGGTAWGLLAARYIDYSHRPVWLIHLSAAAGTVAIAAAIALSGGAGSPAWACLFYVVVFAACFLRAPAAAAYFLACVLVEVVVVLDAAPAVRSQATAKLVVAAPAFLVLGGAIIAGKHFMLSLRRRAERLAAEQGAMQRVATAVVTGEPPERFHQLVAVEAARLLGAGSAGVLRFAGRGEAMVLGSWAATPEGRHNVGECLTVPADSEVAGALSEGRPVHVSQSPDGLLGRLGLKTSVVAPIRVSGRTWGFLAVEAVAGTPAADQARRLTEFADLIATSVSHMEDRATLAAQAATDALTGVGNHRTFHQRLAADLARARRYASPVSVAVIDVDHFKEVNDTGGHEAGDEMLREVARCLTEATRAEDTLARVGGDEFAWILPETTGEEALAAVERARRTILGCGANAGAELPVTISAGVCDSAWSTEPAELVRFADRALYFSKEQGRNRVSLYGADTGALVKQAS